MREAMDIDTDAHEGQPSDDDTRMTRRDEIPMIGKKTDAVLAEEVPTKPPFIYAPGPLPQSDAPLPPSPDSSLIDDLNAHL
jgi:hypothetical protein